jgi:antitoxin component YwqK of YwqJK toxin-antitoxin module
MKLNSYIILVLSFLLSFEAMAQKPGKEMQSSGPINEVDSKGKRHGMWLNNNAPRMGEPGNSEFGNYDHGAKIGQWYKLDNEGSLLSIESFRNNVLDGEVKYYDRGMLYCEGHYRGLNPTHKFDTIVVIDPVTQLEAYRVIPTDNGTMRHGTWRYFNPLNGHLVKVEEYQVDELVYKKEYEVSASFDSTYLKVHEQALPHVKGTKVSIPAGKKTSYLNN